MLCTKPAFRECVVHAHILTRIRKCMHADGILMDQCSCRNNKCCPNTDIFLLPRDTNSSLPDCIIPMLPFRLLFPQMPLPVEPDTTRSVISDR